MTDGMVDRRDVVSTIVAHLRCSVEEVDEFYGRATGGRPELSLYEFIGLYELSAETWVPRHLPPDVRRRAESDAGVMAMDDVVYEAMVAEYIPLLRAVRDTPEGGPLDDEGLDALEAAIEDAIEFAEQPMWPYFAKLAAERKESRFSPTGDIWLMENTEAAGDR